MDPHHEEKLQPVIDAARRALGHQFVDRDVCVRHFNRALYRVGYISQQHQVYLSLTGQVFILSGSICAPQTERSEEEIYRLLDQWRFHNAECKFQFAQALEAEDNQ